MAGERLDKALAHFLSDYSRNRLQAWASQGAVLVDGKVVKARQILRGGEQIRVFPQEMPEQHIFLPENVPLDCIFADDTILIFNKATGMVMHPAAGNWSGTVLNGLLFHYPKLQDLPRAGIVHRLDKDTSGLFVVARTALAQTAIVRLLQDHLVERRYLAWVWGDTPLRGTIDAAVGRDPRDRLKMAVVSASQQGAKSAVTHYKRLALGSLGNAKVSLLECRLETGRTHQIRVHLESLGYPLLGDPIYRKKIPAAAKELSLQRQALHAFALQFMHPKTQTPMSWFAPIPHDLLTLNTTVHLSEAVLPQADSLQASSED
ncbi:MAG: RluA family pseudouridine synthase [Burkholderiaceae bacterium]|nr:RluA family pseudouridine synthase [Burkholderiaceae bacterium]